LPPRDLIRVWLVSPEWNELSCRACHCRRSDRTQLHARGVQAVVTHTVGVYKPYNGFFLSHLYNVNGYIFSSFQNPASMCNFCLACGLMCYHHFLPCDRYANATFCSARCPAMDEKHKNYCDKLATSQWLALILVSDQWSKCSR